MSKLTLTNSTNKLSSHPSRTLSIFQTVGPPSSLVHFYSWLPGPCTLDLPTSHWSPLHLFGWIFPSFCPLKDRAPGIESLGFSSPSILSPPLLVSASFKTFNNVHVQISLIYISILDLSPEVQIGISNRLLNIFIWLSNRPLNVNTQTEMNTLIFTPPLAPSRTFPPSFQLQVVQDKHISVILAPFCLSHLIACPSETLLTPPADCTWNWIHFCRLTISSPV